MQATERKERGIIFSGESVPGILDLRKTMTRRVCRYRGELPEIVDSPRWKGDDFVFWNDSEFSNGLIVKCPYGQPGDRLWVRETWAKVYQCSPPYEDGDPYVIEYRADSGNKYPGRWPDNCGDDPDCGRWKPSIFMPRWASRITLEVTDVRVERVQDISEEDALADGGWEYKSCPVHKSPRKSFQRLWDSLNAKRGYSWDNNPRVWVVEFKLVEGGGE